MTISFVHSLEFLAAVSYAKSLWEEPSVKVEVFEACDSRSYDDNEYREEELEAVTKVLVDKVYREALPESLRNYIAHIVKSMGKKILFWAEYLEKTFGLKIRNPDAIYWTSTGTIDQNKIFQKCVSDMLTKKTSEVCDMAAHCAQVKFLEQNLEVIKHFFKNNPDCSIDSLSACTLLHVSKDFEDFEEFKRIKKRLNNEKKSELANLLSLSIENGCDIAVEYYFNKMNVIDQEDCIYSSAIQCCDLFEKYDYKNYSQGKYVEILIFFTSKMSESQLGEFLSSKKCSVLFMFLSVWPLQEFFIPFFNKIKDFLTYSEYVEILFMILELITRDTLGIERERDVLLNSFLCDEENFNELVNIVNNFHVEIFQMVWHSVTKTCKAELMSDLETHNTPKLCEVIELLFVMFNLHLLKLVINDECLKNQRDQLIEEGNLTFEKLLNAGQFDVMDKFIEEIFCTDVERKNFKLNLNFYDELIRSQRFGEAEKILIWQLKSTTEDRSTFIKSKIDCNSECERLFRKKQFGVADNFLNWVFKTKEEKENFKSLLGSDDYIREKVYEIWADDYLRHLDGRHSIEFLKLFFESEEKINEFKKEKLLFNGKCVDTLFRKMNILYSFVSSKGFPPFEKFLTFCDLSAEKILRIKKNFRKNLPKIFLTNNGNENKMFSMLDYLLTWASTSNDQKKSIIKKLINSIGIVPLWDSIDFRNRDELLKFYNEWIFDCPDIAILEKEILSRFNDSDECFKQEQKIYEKLKKGKKVLITDVAYSKLTFPYIYRVYACESDNDEHSDDSDTDYGRNYDNTDYYRNYDDTDDGRNHDDTDYSPYHYSDTDDGRNYDSDTDYGHSSDSDSD